MRGSRQQGGNQRSALDALLQEKKTGHRSNQMEEEEEFSRTDESMGGFIEDDISSEIEEQQKKRKKKPKKVNEPIMEAFHNQKPVQKKLEPKNENMEQESKDILNNLLETIEEPELNSSSTLNMQQNFQKNLQISEQAQGNQKPNVSIFKTKQEKALDEFDIPLQQINKPRNEQIQQQPTVKETVYEPVVQVKSNLQVREKRSSNLCVMNQNQEQHLQKQQNLQNQKNLQSQQIQVQQITYHQPHDPKIQSSSKISCYIYDVCEDPAHPGTVFLFGKILGKNNEYESVCAQVKDIYRQVFLMPNPEVLEQLGEEQTLVQMEKELAILMSSIYKKNAKNYKVKPVKRKYCFDLDIPKEQSTCLKLKYPFTFPPLPLDTRTKTINYCLGTTYSASELLILKKKIRGPCWINFLNSRSPKTQLSWCKHEFEIHSTDFLKVDKDKTFTPPLKLTSISCQFAKNPENSYQEIVAISVVNVDNYQLDDQNAQKNFQGFSVVRPFHGHIIPYEFDKQQVQDSEFALLNYFMAKLGQIDPDVLVGHYLYNEILELLLTRLQKLNVTTMSKMGRLRKSFGKIGGGILNKARLVCPGRLLCDTFLSAKEVIKENDFSMSHLAEVHLNKSFKEIENVLECYQDNKSLQSLLENNALNSYLTVQLMIKLDILPLTKQLTNIAGNLWIKSLQNARAERNEMLLMHEFHKEKYIWPDKFSNYPQQMDEEKEAKNKKAKYGGGLVLEPVPGLYEKIILLLDFNSLYPSIIQEYSLCFTTVDRPSISIQDLIARKFEEQEDETTQLPEATGDQPLRGILPRVIRQLVLKRKSVKSQLKNTKDEALYKNLDIKQLAIKLVANSIYGCLGFKNSRFYAQPIAALITRTGRQILQNTVNHVQDNLQFPIVYGDTDSIMVNANTEQLGDAIRIGHKIKETINKNYKYLEIEIDGIFKPLLLLKKKKYASQVLKNLSQLMNNSALEPIYAREIKGLDMVRRDWSEISKKCSDYALNTILSGRPKEEIVALICDYLTNLNTQMKVILQIQENKLNLKEFIITKQLTKQISEYKDIKQLPHVAVAARIQQNKNMTGNFIHFVICENPESSQLSDKAFHPRELKNQDKTIDLEYYKNQQIMPVLGRLCQHLENNAIEQFAQALELDVKKFQEVKHDDPEENMQQIYFGEKPSNLDNIEFNIPCLHCGKTTNYQSLFENNKWGLQCTCGKYHHPKVVKNVLMLTLKKLIQKYYEYNLLCTEPQCNLETRQTRLKPGKCMLMSCQGTIIQKYKDQRIYSQIQFFKGLFDSQRFLENPQNANMKKDDIPKQVLDICNTNLTFLNKLLESSKISLKSLLGPLQ